MSNTDAYRHPFGKAPLSDFTCITSSTRSLRLSNEAIGWTAGVADVGSVVVGKIVSIGAYEYLESRQLGEHVRISKGDLIAGVMGNRYSNTYMYGGVPESGIEVPRVEPLEFLSSGGIIGECSAYPSDPGSPTRVHILGVATQGERQLKLSPRFSDNQLRISSPLILIAGTSANVGKTKFAFKLIHFIARELERPVAATKLAGTGDFGDLLSFGHAGAKQTLDFVEAGLATTYGDYAERVVSVAKGVLNELSRRQQSDIIIAELGGDICEANIPALLADSEIRRATQALILVPSDIFAASGALAYLEREGYKDLLSKTYIGQPIKNSKANQGRAWKIIDRHLYDCEEEKDLANLVEKILGWSIEKESQIPQTEAPMKLELHTAVTT